MNQYVRSNFICYFQETVGSLETDILGRILCKHFKVGDNFSNNCLMWDILTTPSLVKRKYDLQKQP